MGKPRAKPSFHRGNKRTAFAATYTFLAINGTGITADAESAYGFITGLYEANDFTFENLLAWLRENVAPTTTGAATTTLSRKPSQDSAQTSMRSK